VTTLQAIIATRGRASVVRAQQESWLMLERLVAVDPEWYAELAHTRAGKQAPIVRDRAAIVRACAAGALAPDEAVTLFRRTQGT
jgi:hypothetical protein